MLPLIVNISTLPKLIIFTKVVAIELLDLINILRVTPRLCSIISSPVADHR